jgi:hypothetical protein
MGYAQFILFLVGIVLSARCNICTVEPTHIVKTFTPSQELFANPERGWIVHRYSHDMWGLHDLRNSAEKVSLILIKIDLSEYVNCTHIGHNKLNEIRVALDNCRAHGLKVILRSAYAWQEVLGPDPEEIQTIKNHVIDMKSIYQQYDDLIVAVEMGMFGPWGEMHSSRHSTIKTNMYYPIEVSALKHIHNVYMLALPLTHSVLVRRPYYIRQIFDDDKPILPNEAYTNTPKARTGYHNDAYLNSISDGGTFSHGWSRNQELEYINDLTRYNFFGGESFGTPNDTYNNAKHALLESKQQHMTYLHRDYYKPIFDAWDYSTREDFTRQLGYRFELKNLSHSQEVAPGGMLYVCLKLQNYGFSAMHLRRPVSLVLDNGKAGAQNIQYQTTLSVDPRTWTPEAKLINIERKLRIPASIDEGIWQLRLVLPDRHINLQADGRYAVRFANEHIWNTDGTNLLVEKIPISASVSGSRTHDDVFEEITAVSVSSVSQISAIKTAKFLTVSASYDKDYFFHQVFIDNDGDSTTGYRVENIGADLLVENNYTYVFTGKHWNDWSWQHLNDTMTVSINRFQYVWQILLTNLQQPITSLSRVLFAGTQGNEGYYSSIISVTINSNEDT